MKIKPSLRYQLYDQRTAILVYYGVMVAMILLNLLFLPFAGDSDLRVTSGGITAVTAVFVFVVALCSFKESFLLELQHGVSRRCQFLSHLAAMGVSCAVMAVADEIYTLFITLLSLPFPNSVFSYSLYEMCYVTEEVGPDMAAYATIHTSPATALLSIVFSFFVLLAISAFGYLITTFNYRLHKWGKIIFWAGWPVMLIALGTLLDHYPAQVASMKAWLLQACFTLRGSLPLCCLTCLALAAVFSGLSWLLMRRAQMK